LIRAYVDPTEPAITQSDGVCETARVASRREFEERAKAAVRSTLTRRGLELRRVPSESEPASVPPPVADQMIAYFERAAVIEARHNAQTADTVAMLERKYETPALGEVRVWTVVELLAQCIDPSDGRLFGASQLFHVLQMLEAMERDGLDDPDVILAALVHDVGKVLLLTGEDPAHVVCMTQPIVRADGPWEPGIGLDNVMMQWNHDVFAFNRLRDHLPDHIAWLVRYHSIEFRECEPLMDARDRDYFERYLRPFSYYDHETKTPFQLPQRRIDDYRDLVEEAFPEPIRF
jgi:inositol oxygenase